jgi:hypothetical protein
MCAGGVPRIRESATNKQLSKVINWRRKESGEKLLQNGGFGEKFVGK